MKNARQPSPSPSADGPAHDATPGPGKQTRVGSEASLALISADPQQRAERIHRVLRTGAGNRHSFEQITPWLMGSQPAQLAAAYQAVAQVSLTDAITRAFSQPFMRGYLLDVAEHGEPQLGSRLAMASGLVTSTRSDWPEVLRLLRAAKPDEVTAAIADPTLKRHLETSSRVKAVIDVSGKQEAHDQAGDETTKEALDQAKSTELVAIVHHRQQIGRGLDRDKLAIDLSAWAKANDKPIRDQATQAGSPFVAALAKLGAPDRAYLIAVAQGGAPVADEMLKPDAEAEPDKRAKDAEEAGLKVGELDAYLDRKAASNHALKPPHWSTLKAKIEGLDDDQRAIYLRQHMTTEQRAIFDGADSTAAQRAEVRGQAMATIRTRLLTAGMSAAVADRVMAAFQTGAAPDSTKYHSTYQKLRRLALGGPALRFSHDALKLVGQLTNQEYLQVRDDSALMTALQTRCDAATWTQITAVLGHDPAGTVNADGLTGKPAREHASNEAELDPMHWTALLQRELAKNPLSRHEDKVLSVATRAYYAAQRRAALPSGDDGRKPELPRGLAPMSVPVFTAEVLAKLGSDERTQLEREDPAGYQALHTGRAVPANARIDAATFSVISPKRLKGTNARPSDLQRAVDDAQGRELLEEWSNVDTWRTLQAQAREAAGTPRAVALDAQMRAFVVDVNPEVHAQLERLLPRDKLLTVLTKLREKLGKAMKDDPSFRASMVVANLPADGHAQERTKGLAALDQQRMENSGAQWNSLAGIGVSAKSAEGKESSNVLAGRLRSAHQTIEGADDKEAERAKVNDDQVADITKAREEHADRMKSAQALKKRANEIATTVVTILSGIAITGATFGTGGLAFAPQVGIALGKALAAGVLKGALKRALEGDKFNAVDTISSITLDLMVTSVMTAGIGAPTGVTEHAEVAAGLKGKKDAASLFADAGLKWAVNTGVREAISTTTTAMMDPDPKKLTLDQEAMVRLRAWVEDFALTMASTEAGRHTAGETQAQKDTTKLIPGAVKPVTAELTRPIDDKVKAERRVMGKPMAIQADPLPAGEITAEQLTEGRDQLRERAAPTPAPLDRVRVEIARGRALANALARTLTAHNNVLSPGLIMQGQTTLVDLRLRIDQVLTAMAMGGTTREQHQLAVTQLQVLSERADEANANIVAAALAALPAAPTHTPVAAPVPPARTEDRQAEAMLS